MDPSITQTPETPPVPQSLHFHPHIPVVIPTEMDQPSLDPVSDPESPLSATTVVDGSTIDDNSLGWITSLISIPQEHSMPTITATSSPSATTTSAEPNSNTSTSMKDLPGETATPTSTEASISRGAKIGVALGIAVAVLLALIALSLCVLDVRRRLRRKKERHSQQQEEFNMWEAEIRNGNVTTQIGANGGLWGDLKAPEPPSVNKKGLWERVGEMRSESGSTQGESATVRNERQDEWLPVYLSRERTSVVSLAGSLGLPIMGSPVGVKSILSEESKRKRDDSMG